MLMQCHDVYTMCINVDAMWCLFMYNVALMCDFMTFIQHYINVDTTSWHLYNDAFMSMQRHYIASTLIWHCIEVMCCLGRAVFCNCCLLWDIFTFIFYCCVKEGKYSFLYSKCPKILYSMLFWLKFGFLCSCFSKKKKKKKKNIGIANSVDPDQTVSAKWSRSALLAYETLPGTLVFEILEHSPYYNKVELCWCTGAINKLFERKDILSYHNIHIIIG